MKLFILFGGFLMPSNVWNYNLETNKKTNFITKLKKIGDVHFFTPEFYNIEYLNPNKNISKYFDKLTSININDIDYKKQVKICYKDVKSKIYDEIILIATSIGIHFAVEYSKIDKRVTAIISIEGSSIGPNALIKFDTTLKSYQNNKKKYDNDYFKNLIKNNDYNKLKEIINNILTSKINFKLNKFPVKSLHIQNLIILNNMSDKDTQKNLLKINTVEYFNKHDDKYHYNYVINKTHVAFWFDVDNIIKMIKYFI